MALAVDAEFNRAEALLNGISASSALARGDLDSFEGEMRAASALFGGAVLTLVTIEGRIALLTAWAPGERRVGVQAPDQALQVLASGRVEVSNLFRGTATGKPAVAVGVPVLGAPDASGQRVVLSGLGLSLPQAWVAAALEAQRVPDAPGWVGTVTDRAGAIVARTRGGGDIIGQPMRREIQALVAAASEGVLRGTTTREGVPAVTAFAHGPRSGYSYVLTMPETEFEAPLHAALTRILGFGGLVAAVGVALAVLLARRTVAAFQGLTALVAGGVTPASTGLREADDLAAAFTAALEERNRSERHRRLVVAELDHRAKNLLATVQAVAAQSLRGAGSTDPSQFAADFQGRLRALARTHDLLTSISWEAAELSAVVHAALSPWLSDDSSGAGSRIDLSYFRVARRSVHLFPGQAQTLSLALHELATNAVKHGALSVSGGRVAVTCHEDAGRVMELHWIETGGPPIANVPTRRGFGTRLLEQALARELGAGAAVRLRFEPGGLQASIRFAPQGCQTDPAGNAQGAEQMLRTASVDRVGER
ncbi:sensor histidine kinase [Roseomonas sp. KE2513]|uniref:sensor histidine kinase n=1 Tax=Roseomonas sp. KE2513 TaxID=2479202 RepID=UPI0018DFCF70|nr:sensor histidine kinase [Roseomonas sp. KE2513]